MKRSKNITAVKNGYSGSWPRWQAYQGGRLIIFALFRRKKDALAFGNAFENEKPGSSYRTLRPVAFKYGAYYVA